MSSVKTGVGRVEVAPVESEREKRLMDICVKAWRRHLMEQRAQGEEPRAGEVA